MKAIGDASLQVGEATIQLLDVLYVPSLKANLLSVQGLIENGARVTFDEFGTTIRQNDGTQVYHKRNRAKGCFEVHGQALALELDQMLEDVPEDNQNTGTRYESKTSKTSQLWHERFGHPGRNKTQQIQKHYLGLDEKMEHESRDCHACSQGKQTRTRMGPSTSEPASAPLELVHVDLMTDFKGHANYHYTLVAVDDFSSLVYAEPLCTKSAALPALQRWIKRMERATDQKLKRRLIGKPAKASDGKSQCQGPVSRMDGQRGQSGPSRRRCAQCSLAEVVEGSFGHLQSQRQPM